MELQIFAPSIPKQYHGMIELINTKIGQLGETSNNFYKTQSQFMDNVLTVAQLTPIRSLRQILSEIERIQAALTEAHFKRKKINLEIEARVNTQVEALTAVQNKLRLIEIEELRAGIESSNKYIAASIRRLTAYIEQFESIAKKFNCLNFTEADFEKQEEEYHIKTAFSQAITAARARDGLVDEGNHIYFMQLGISGHDAQRDITDLFKKELSSNTDPKSNYKLIIDFLETSYQKYKGQAYNHMEYRGLSPISKTALLSMEKNA